MIGSTDQQVRDFLVTLRHRGSIVSSTIVIAVAKAFISKSCDKSVKNLFIAQSWVQSFFLRNRLCPINVNHSQSPYT